MSNSRESPARRAGKAPANVVRPKKRLRLNRSARYVLRLFVAGATARSQQAVLHVRQMCAAQLLGDCDLQVIDIYQQPRMARLHQIVATPTLVKEWPRPERRFIGSLLNLALSLPKLAPIVGRKLLF
ncbi:MAG: circadian clock KaiB family protein [Opitutus sp.]